jgi:hypothetical protein
LKNQSYKDQRKMIEEKQKELVNAVVPKTERIYQRMAREDSEKEQ